MGDDEPYVGEIRLFAGATAPRGWLFCQGQSLNLAEYYALFAVIGSTFGGDGSSSFNLPDLRGRVPVGANTSALNGRSPRPAGSNGGAEQVVLAIASMPAHSHAIQGTLQAQFQVSTDQGSQQAPSAGALISVGYYKTGASHFVESYVPSGSPSTSMGGLSTTMTGSVDSAGTGSAHGNMQPWAVLNYMIAVVGIFPSPNN